MLRDYLPGLRKQHEVSRRPANIADLMDDFWREPFGLLSSLPFAKGLDYPAVDVSETDTEIVARAEVPGLEPKDVEITIRDNVLTLRGEKKFEEEEKKDNYHRIERSYGSFCRSLTLPAHVKEDDVKAKLEKGVLTITMTKAEEEHGRKIEIGA